MKNKVVWFSRHQLTPDQKADIAARFPDWQLVWLRDLGRVGINTDAQLADVMTGLLSAVNGGAAAIYGVFAPPIQAAIWRLGDDFPPVFAAWNVLRKQTGGMDTFKHLKFVQVGGRSA